jgi:hypothetical protein
MASAFTRQSRLRRKRLIPCHSLASPNMGSTHTLRLRKAFSECTPGDSGRVLMRSFDEELLERVRAYRGSAPYGFRGQALQLSAFARYLLSLSV